MRSSMPTFAANALLVCESCGEIFVNWTAKGSCCRACGGLELHEIRWPPPP